MLAGERGVIGEMGELGELGELEDTGEMGVLRSETEEYWWGIGCIKLPEVEKAE